MSDTLEHIDVPHPGFFIREELDARGWNQRDLAYILGTPEQAVNLIISGKRGISPEMAKALGEAFEVHADFFANLQKAYDMARARDPDPGVSKRARLQSVYPVREMIKRCWFTDTDADMLEVQMSRFFKVANTNEIPHVMAHAAKKTHYDAVPASQLAWLFRVRQIAEAMPSVPYSERKLREALSLLRTFLIDPEEARHVPRLLMEAGVRLVIVEGLSGGKIDGVCFWLDERSPVIGITMLHDRIDNFWFVLRHEIEHVLQKHGMEVEVIDIELGKSLMGHNKPPAESDQEEVANTAAAEFCVPQKDMTSFIVRKTPFFAERDVLGFAKRVQVHPGIIVGQIQHRTGRWDLLRKHLVKIRQYVLPGAMVDGWGQVAPVSL
jgi:HTH-type transcriptional regulator/antitoxin HigA